MKANFFSQSLEDLERWMLEQGERKFRASQVLQWVYEKGVQSFEAMSNISEVLRQKLSSSFCLSQTTFVRCQDSGDGETYKFLWRLKNGSLVESVLICSGERRTVCVSSQVGCPARCAFCASGKAGFFSNLEAGEIVSQVWMIQQWLAKKNERVSHVVFMGMGEPLENYEAVVKTIGLLKDEKMMNLSQRRITVSTVGVIEGIYRFAEQGLRVNLVLSLHAPNQKVRKKIIPYARKYPLEEVMAAMDTFFQKTKRDITYEYILIAGVNDSEEHACELAQLIGERQCTVNLIPYNPVEGLKLRRPSVKAIEAFRKVLTQKKIHHTCRYTKGDDIAAACGQLALLENAS